MSDAFNELLEATVTHLQELREHGVRFVATSPETLASLGVSTATAAPTSNPTKAPATGGLSSLKAALGPAPKSAPAAAPARPAAPRAPAPILSAPEPASSVAPLSAAAKEQAMADLRQRALACVKCPNLVAARRNVVFGVGDIHSPLMFVGEAPGQEEDEQGEPFVGKAGQLLTKIIQTMGLSRDRVYIANILKCRPDTPGQAYGNRKPTLDEMNTCKPYVLSQIDIIQPKVIVALGATAVEGLLGNTTGIMKLRGNWQTFRGVPVMPTFHPAYLLRNQAITEKRKVWEDMLAVMEKLGMPISEKQRAFFSKG
jgi:DNA polymerase